MDPVRAARGSDDRQPRVVDRARFDDLLRREGARALRFGSAFTVTVCRVQRPPGAGADGEADGGQVLAAALDQQLREVDYGAALGNGHFAAVMVGANAERARIPVARLRTHLAAAGWELTCGMASVPHHTLDGQRALALARSRMTVDGSCPERVPVAIEGDAPDPGARLLLVDDDARNLKLLRAMLTLEGHEVSTASDGHEALEVLRTTSVELVLLDVMMPGMDGYEVCRRIKRTEETRLLPVVMLTALDDLEAKVRGVEAGADEFMTKPPNRVELLTRIRALVNAGRANSRLIGVENMLVALAAAVESKDPYTQGHSQRVSGLCVALARRAGLDATAREAARLGGILHDVGKIAVPRQVLNHPGRLDEEGWAHIRTHPAEGHLICLSLERSLGPALDAILHHHERLDGSGYPGGLAGDEIGVLARITAVADVFDALVSDRAYRRAMPHSRALQVLDGEAQAGRLDRGLVEELAILVARGI